MPPRRDASAMPGRPAVAACGAAVLCAAVAAAAPVDVDRLRVTVVAPDASSVVKRAAADLRTLLKRLYGVDVPEAHTSDGLGPDEAAVVLGRAALAAGILTSDDLRKVSPGGYVVKCGGNRIAIAGASVWTTYYGMVGFLEHVGVRFYLPDISRAYVPEAPARTIGPIELFDRPTFAYRAGWSLLLRQGSSILGDPRRGLNPELFTKKANSDLWIDHTAGYLVPKLLYHDEHPEYYAVGKDGRRVAKDGFSDHRTPLCLSNPEVTRISIQRALKWIELNPDHDLFGITYGDTGLWCQCPQCLKLDPAPGEYASRLLHWVNPVARAVAERYPGKMLTTFAYGGTDKVPPVARPEKNVWMVVATGTGNLPFFDHAMAQDASVTGKIEEWIAAAPGRVMVCEYLGAYEPAMLEQMTGRLRHYARIGLWAVKTTYGAPANFRQLWEYVWSRMTWDPQQDARALANEFARFHYGAAAGPLRRFFDLTHERYRATLAASVPLVDGQTGYPAGYYCGAFVKECLGCFTGAIAAVADSPSLTKALQIEQGLFLKDVVNHMPAYDLSEESNGQLLECLGFQRDLARQTGGEAQFLRDAQALAAALEKKRAGYRELIEKWLGTAAVPLPVEIRNGLRFTPLMFLRCDYGPGMFPGGGVRSHPDCPSPPKLCAGVYMKAKGGHGQVTSSRMLVDFELSPTRAGRQATLEIEGQDAISHWMGKNGVGWKTSIKIFVNDREIFSGECGFVRGNWSRRRFEVPAGCLKAGKNRLEIQNASGRGWFAGCWFLLSDATLTFAGAVGE